MTDWGLLGDASGLSRAEKRAALLVIQNGYCATCDIPDPAEADHDHATGLLRGLLCKSCNVTEGRRFILDEQVRARFDAYRANPPAGRAWFWDFPEYWSPEDTRAVRQRGTTILDYVLTVWPDRLAEIHAAIDAEVIAMGQRRNWPAL